jgi:hypothetical protein
LNLVSRSEREPAEIRNAPDLFRLQLGLTQFLPIKLAAPVGQESDFLNLSEGIDELFS